MSIPKGYEKAPEVAESSDFEQPASYRKRRRDEHSPPRPPMVSGRPKICQVCYRNQHDLTDLVCPRCLKDWNELAKLEVEIAKVFPATARMPRPQIFRRVWERHQKLAAQVAKLKVQLACCKEDIAEMTRPARVGVR